MKKIILILLISVMAAGCATSHLATDVSTKIGRSFQESASKGIPSAEETIAAWPYISGLIRGLLAEEYKYQLSPSITSIIDRLDELAGKDELTVQNTGEINGLIVRLENLTGKEFWDKYGISLFGAIKAFLVGG